MKPTAVVLTPQSLDGGAGLGAGGVSIHSNDSAEGVPFILDILRAWRGLWVVLLWRRWEISIRVSPRISCRDSNSVTPTSNYGRWGPGQIITLELYVGDTRQAKSASHSPARSASSRRFYHPLTLPPPSTHPLLTPCSPRPTTRPSCVAPCLCRLSRYRRILLSTRSPRR